MKSKKLLIITALLVQLLLIFFYIYTQSKITHLTYQYQDAERAHEKGEKDKKKLIQELAHLKDPDTLKKYASTELQMKKARLSDIHELPDDHQNE